MVSETMPASTLCILCESESETETESEVTQSRPTVSDPMDCSPPGSSVHGIFQARVGVPLPSDIIS